MTNRATMNIWAALTGLLLIAPLSAQAQPSSAQQNAIRQSCRSDFMANCGGVQPGGREALECLQHHVGRLSPACQSAVRATMAAPAKAAPPMHAPPRAAAEPPAAPPPPSGPAVAPLKLRAFIMPQRRIIILGICGGDVSRVCPGVPPGAERPLKCLAAHAAELSRPCYNAIARVSER